MQIFTFWHNYFISFYMKMVFDIHLHSFTQQHTHMLEESEKIIKIGGCFAVWCKVKTTLNVLGVSDYNCYWNFIEFSLIKGVDLMRMRTDYFHCWSGRLYIIYSHCHNISDGIKNPSNSNLIPPEWRNCGESKQKLSNNVKVIKG